MERCKLQRHLAVMGVEARMGAAPADSAGCGLRGAA